MNPTETARQCAEELAKQFGGFEYPNSLLHQLATIIQRHIDAYTAELKAENESLKKALESESKGTLIVEVHRLKKALEKAQEEINWQKFVTDKAKHPELEYGVWKARESWSADKQFVAWACDHGYGFISTGNLHAIYNAAVEKANGYWMCELLKTRTDQQQLRAQLTLSQERERELVAAFHHNHVSDNQSDVCKSCGLDLRDSIHNRADKAKAALKGSEHCHAGSDGECHWGDCPQLRDGEPNKSGRHCPLDDREA